QVAETRFEIWRSFFVLVLVLVFVPEIELVLVVLFVLVLRFCRRAKRRSLQRTRDARGLFSGEGFDAGDQIRKRSGGSQVDGPQQRDFDCMPRAGGFGNFVLR